MQFAYSYHAAGYLLYCIQQRGSGSFLRVNTSQSGFILPQGIPTAYEGVPATGCHRHEALVHLYERLASGVQAQCVYSYQYICITGQQYAQILEPLRIGY